MCFGFHDNLFLSYCISLRDIGTAVVVNLGENYGFFDAKGLLIATYAAYPPPLGLHETVVLRLRSV